MITVADAAGIALVALGLALTPGPNMLYLLSRSLSQGTGAGLLSLAGVGAGFAIWLGAAVAGLAAVLAAVPGAYTAVRVIGALYLLYLAWQNLRRQPRGLDTGNLEPDPPRRLFTTGLLTNLLNPKIAVLYLSLLPQFVDPDRGSVALQSVALGAVQITVAMTVLGAFVLGAGRLAQVLNGRPGWLTGQKYFVAAVLAALAIGLLLDI
jgi:threonine/homoserine/homoserine lactone efflux protein